MDKNFLIFYRWILTNLTGILLLIFAWFLGYVDTVIASDQTGVIIWSIFGLFAWGSVVTGQHALKIGLLCRNSQKSVDFQDFKRYLAVDKTLAVELQKQHYLGKVRYLQLVATVLVMLGLLGTVIGFIITLSGVTPDAVGNYESVKTLVTAISSGMGTALYTTLVGTICNIWLNVNYQIITTGYADLLALMVRKATNVL